MIKKSAVDVLYATSIIHVSCIPKKEIWCIFNVFSFSVCNINIFTVH